MRKAPEADLRFQYRRVLEGSAVVALALISLVFILWKKFEGRGQIKAIEVPVIQVEDIPITRTVKRVEAPRKPTIPIEDPEINPDVDIEIPDVDITDIMPLPPPPPPPVEEEVFTFFKVEKVPELIGGERAIQEYIIKNNLFPKMAVEAGISGVALIGFIVEKDGSTSDVQVIQEKPPNLGFGEAGVKVMQAMRFTPGYQRDKPVRVRMQQPIRFTIE